jgi:hypothetical protein
MLLLEYSTWNIPLGAAVITGEERVISATAGPAGAAGGAGS